MVQWHIQNGTQANGQTTRSPPTKWMINYWAPSIRVDFSLPFAVLSPLCPFMRTLLSILILYDHSVIINELNSQDIAPFEHLARLFRFTKYG